MPPAPTRRSIAGPREDGYGIESLSIGGHASEELAASWDSHFLGPRGMDETRSREAFDPDFAVVTWEQNGGRQPYIPGSSLRGPLRHAMSRLLKARGVTDTELLDDIFGTTERSARLQRSARLLIRDAFLKEDGEHTFAWLQAHAEDEFTAGAYGSSKFDRIAVMQGTFEWKMVLEDLDKAVLEDLFRLAESGQIGIGGGQWRGHGWLRWEFDKQDSPE